MGFSFYIGIIYMNIPFTDIHAALNTMGSVSILGLETMQATCACSGGSRNLERGVQSKRAGKFSGLPRPLSVT